jgi:membrane protein required for colicin V production
MNSFDLFVAACVLLFLCFGLWRGAARQIVSLIGLGAGVFLALRWHASLAGMLPFGSEKLRLPLSFALIVLLVMLAAYLVGWMLTKLVSAIGLGWLNRLFGGIISLAKAALVILAVAILLVEILPGQSQTLRDSKVLPWVLKAESAAVSLIPADARLAVNEKLRDLENFWNNR